MGGSKQSGGILAPIGRFAQQPGMVGIGEGISGAFGGVNNPMSSPGLQMSLMGMQQPRFSQNAAGAPAAPTPQPQSPGQVDPRLQMWIQQQMQRRQAGEMPRFTHPMTIQDRMGMMGPGLASIRAGATQGPTRLAGMQQGISTGNPPSQNLQGVQTGANDLVTNRRRGILG